VAHAALVGLVLGLHASVLLAAIAAFQVYGERSEAFQKSLYGTDELKTRLNAQIANALAAALSPVFQNAGSEPTLLVNPSGVPILSYQEVPINVVGSEAYREAVRDFVEQGADLLTDYRVLRSARDRWCGWSQRLSWGILLLLVWQAIAGVGIAADQFGFVNVPDRVVYGSLVPTAAIFFLNLACLFPRMRSHDSIMKLRAKHDVV